MQSHIENRVKLWVQIKFKGQKSVSTVFLRLLADFRCTPHSVRLQKLKVHLLTLNRPGGGLPPLLVFSK